MQEEKRRKIFGIPGNNTFLPYDEGYSEANERAIRWAHDPNVKTGDWKLESYHQRWYIIEKFDDTDLKYQVTKFVRQNEFNNVKKQWEEQYGQSDKGKVESYNDEINNLYREAVKYREERSNFNDDVLKQSRESKDVLGLGENQNSRQQTAINSRGSNAYSNTNSKGKAFGLDNDPNARKSKDDTIYLSAVERGDKKTRTSHISASAGRLFYNDTDICNIMLPDYRYILPLRSRSSSR